MSGDKTEKATPKRLQDLRRKGVAARSVELPQGVSMLLLALVLPGMVRRLWDALQADLVLVLGTADSGSLETGWQAAATMASDCLRAVAPGVAVVAVTALLAGSAVTASRPNPSVLRPRWQRLSPAASVKRLVGPHGLVELLRNVVKLSLLAAVTVGVWQQGYAELLASGGDWRSLGRLTGQATHDMLLRVAAVALLVGVADAIWQRRSFRQQSRMSRQEIQDEMRQSEGDPRAKAHRRGLMLAASRSRMISAVPKADVVLANPTHLVVALAYAPGSPAPVVVARGAGAVADRIKQVAREAGVPVLADKPLARALYRASEVGDSIPLELFRAVAEVLAVVYAAKRRGTAPVWSKETVLT